MTKVKDNCPDSLIDWGRVMVERQVRFDPAPNDDLVRVGDRSFRCADRMEARYAVEIIREVLEAAMDIAPQKIKVTA